MLEYLIQPIVSVIEDGFTTDFSFNIQIFPKEIIQIIFFEFKFIFSTKNYQERSIVLSEICETARIKHTSHEIYKFIRNGLGILWMKTAHTRYD